ncbi:MAG: ion channel [Ferruginibacter sp.]
MALLNKINAKARTSDTTGFGDNASNYGGRLLTKNGQANIYKTGLRFFEKYSWFHSMLALSWWNFYMIIIGFYIVVNLFFALIYYFIGVDQLAGLQTNTEGQKFAEAFFFSAQTFTTVGYGRISPTGITTSAIAAFQALTGLLSFAVATGLVYGRFSKPTAYLKFSENGVIAPFKNSTALMIRVAPFKNTTLTEAETQITLAIRVDDNGKSANRFYPLDLELTRVNALTLSWTIVHPITENSPLYNFTEQDFKNVKGEIMVFIKAFDDMFSNTVVARTSYTFSEIVYGAKYLPMYHRDEMNSVTILDLQKLNEFEPASLPVNLSLNP